MFNCKNWDNISTGNYRDTSLYFLYFSQGLLHDFPRFSLQSSEALEADLDAGHTTGETDTGGEREAASEGPEDGTCNI